MEELVMPFDRTLAVASWLGTPARALSMRSVVTLAAISLCLLQVTMAGSAAVAQTEDRRRTVSASWRAVDPAIRLEVRDGAIQLALEDALAIALSRNLGLQVQRFERSQSLFLVEQNLGMYDTRVSATGFAQDETTPSASALEGAAIRQLEVHGLNFRVDQLNTYGGTLSLDSQNDRTATNSIFFDINPSFGVDLDLIYAQPLLRDFGKLVTNRSLRIARLDSGISLQNLERAVIGVIEQVETTYWSLVENRAQLGVAEESLALANQLHEMNRVQVDVGTKAPLELVQSEAGIAIRQEEIIRVRAARDDAADELRRLLNLEDAALWSAEIVPTTAPEIDRIEVDLEQALAAALAERTELAVQRLAVETLEIDERFFRNQKLPTVDLQVRYGFNGTGGDVVLVRDPVTGNPLEVAEGGFDDATQQIIDRDFRGWQVGVNVAYPIQNRAARANHTIARLAVQRGSTQLEDLELQVRTEVRQAARGVETAAQQIDSAGKSRELSERNLEAEQKKYENGLSTSFQVLQIQEDLSAARSREVNAITGYRRALVRYYQAIGRLLEENDVEIEDIAEIDSVRPDTE
jgi:outer membrane protein